MSKSTKKLKDCVEQTRKFWKKKERRRRKQRNCTIDMKMKKNKMKDSSSKLRNSRERLLRRINALSSCTKI
jgi:hypothetical protein